MSATWHILEGDCRETLATLPVGSVQTCVTSPPYFGLRDYGHDGQIGLEPTPDEYVAALVEVFREVRRVLRDDGTVWLNLGDNYGAHKQLLGVPWSVAKALQVDGWVLRSDIIWSKPNPMPESVTDRPTKSHEYLFLLSKGPRYFYDADAIREPDNPDGRAITVHSQRGHENYLSLNGRERWNGGRNKRSVWTVAPQSYAGAHFATFPPTLVEPCILAGSQEGDTVLDPCAGSGTTGMVALRHGRSFVGCELNPEYVRLARNRIIADSPLLNTHAEAA